MRNVTCPSQRELSDYAAGVLDDTVAERLSTHLSECESCLGSLNGLIANETLTRELRRDRAGPSGSAVYQKLEARLLQSTDQLPTIPNYRFGPCIGRGGMGRVFQAFHTKLEKTVAIKLIRGTRHPELVSRFEREMKAVGRLDHPNVVRATDAGEADGTPYLVMEYVDGVDLQTLVQKSAPLTHDLALNYISQLANGLAAAHAQGIVHRDVKPSNAILTSDGTVKLLDLGLALFPDSDEESGIGEATAGTVTAKPLTQAGKAMGTRDYMAPEQATRPQDADARADVYGLGATLWFLLTGQPPPENPTQSPSKPECVSDKVWAKMLAANPAERFESIAEFQNAIRPKPPTRRRTTFAFLAMLLMPIGVWAAWPQPQDVSESSSKWSTIEPRMPPGGTLPMTPEVAKLLQSEWAEALKRRLMFIDHVKSTYRLIPPGQFKLGSAMTTITRPYYMAETEVTVAQFRFFVNYRKYLTEVEANGFGGTVTTLDMHNPRKLDPNANWKTPGYATEDDYPVTQVSWLDAVAYCEWLSATGQMTFRLPTEAEWIWAAMAGEAEIEHAQKDASPFGWVQRQKALPFSPRGVKQLLPNAWGLYDTTGNVSEWCLDWYGDYPKDATENYAGPESHPRKWHVTQGTHFASTTPVRLWRWRSNSCGDTLGFRVLAEIK